MTVDYAAVAQVSQPNSIQVFRIIEHSSFPAEGGIWQHTAWHYRP